MVTVEFPGVVLEVTEVSEEEYRSFSRGWGKVSGVQITGTRTTAFRMAREGTAAKIKRSRSGEKFLASFSRSGPYVELLSHATPG